MSERSIRNVGLRNDFITNKHSRIRPGEINAVNLASKLGCSVATLYRAIKEGRIKPVRQVLYGNGKGHIFNWSDVPKIWAMLAEPDQDEIKLSQLARETGCQLESLKLALKNGIIKPARKISWGSETLYVFNRSDVPHIKGILYLYNYKVKQDKDELSQKQLSKEFGVSKKYVSDMVSAHVVTPVRVAIKSENNTMWFFNRLDLGSIMEYAMDTSVEYLKPWEITADEMMRMIGCSRCKIDSVIRELRIEPVRKVREKKSMTPIFNINDAEKIQKYISEYQLNHDEITISQLAKELDCNRGKVLYAIKLGRIKPSRSLFGINKINIFRIFKRLDIPKIKNIFNIINQPLTSNEITVGQLADKLRCDASIILSAVESGKLKPAREVRVSERSRYFFDKKDIYRIKKIITDAFQR